jgi:hypothetical protein
VFVCLFVFIIFKVTSFTSSTFPIQPDFSQNQPAATTLAEASQPQEDPTVGFEPLSIFKVEIERERTVT